MGLTLVTPPTEWPVTLDEAKAQLRVRHTDEDALITSLIKAATAHTEKLTGLSLTTRTWRLTLDAFADYIELPRGPVQSVTAVRYYDAAGEQQTVSASEYTTDLLGRRPWIVRNSDVSWPSTLGAINTVSVDYVAGFEELPADYEDLKHAILLLIGHWYETRATVNVGNIANEVPLAYDALVHPYRQVLV